MTGGPTLGSPKKLLCEFLSQATPVVSGSTVLAMTLSVCEASRQTIRVNLRYSRAAGHCERCEAIWRARFVVGGDLRNGVAGNIMHAN